MKLWDEIQEQQDKIAATLGVKKDIDNNTSTGNDGGDDEKGNDVVDDVKK